MSTTRRGLEHDSDEERMGEDYIKIGFGARFTADPNEEALIVGRSRTPKNTNVGEIYSWFVQVALTEKQIREHNKRYSVLG